MNSTLENIYQLGVAVWCVQQIMQVDQQEGGNYKHVMTEYVETAQVKTKKKSHLYCTNRDRGSVYTVRHSHRKSKDRRRLRVKKFNTTNIC